MSTWHAVSEQLLSHGAESLLHICNQVSQSFNMQVNTGAQVSSFWLLMPLGLDFLPVGMQWRGQTKVEPGHLSPDLASVYNTL